MPNIGIYALHKFSYTNSPSHSFIQSLLTYILPNSTGNRINTLYKLIFITQACRHHVRRNLCIKKYYRAAIHGLHFHNSTLTKLIHLSIKKTFLSFVLRILNNLKYLQNFENQIHLPYLNV